MTAQEYFEAHTLDLEYLKRTFAIQFDEEKITIPIYDQTGKLLYCKFRHLNSKPKFSFEKGGHPALFCSHKITKHGSVVLGEGEPDVMRLWQAGIPAVTGTSGVATFNAKLAEPLRKKTVYLCLDNDEAGQKEVEQYCEVLSQVEATVRIVSLPEGFKDVSEFLSSVEPDQGKIAFARLMKEAIDLDTWLDRNEPKEFGWETAKQLVEANIPQQKWLIDRILPREGFSFLAGPEGSGKSFYALTLAESVAYGKAWLDKFAVPERFPILIIDKENSRATIQSRLIGLGIDDQEEMIHRILFPEFLQILGEKGEFSSFIKSVSRRVKKLGVRLIIIDSFTDIMMGNENARDDTQQFFDSFKQLFPNTCIFVLHHINKAQAGLSRSSSERFRGSSNITAQLYTGFLVKPVPKAINEFTIEQTKSREMTKLPEFKVNLVSMVDPADTSKTYVSKVMYAGEVVDEDAKGIQTVDIIKELLEQNEEITRSEIEQACLNAGQSLRTVQRAISGMKEAGVLAYRKEGRKHIYYRPGVVKTNDENEENTEYYD